MKKFLLAIIAAIVAMGLSAQTDDSLGSVIVNGVPWTDNLGRPVNGDGALIILEQ